MTAKITKTDEQKQVLDQAEQSPVFFVDGDGASTHVVFPIDDARQMFDDYLRRELQIGFDQADRGQVVEWDSDKIKAEGRKRLDQRSETA